MSLAGRRAVEGAGRETVGRVGHALLTCCSLEYWVVDEWCITLQSVLAGDCACLTLRHPWAASSSKTDDLTAVAASVRGSNREIWTRRPFIVRLGIVTKVLHDYPEGLVEHLAAFLLA